MPGFRRLTRGLLVAALLLPLPAVATTYTSLTVLGDSLSDQGNLLAATSDLGPSLGQAAQPDAGRYFEGRFSNGPVYTDVLARNLGVSLAPSLLGGTNFAFGGARTDYNTVEVPPFGGQVFPRAAYPWSLNLQRDAFTARAASTGVDPGGLYAVFSGSNDVADIIQRRLDPASTIANAVTGITGVVDAFRAAGAETILVPNLPDLGRVPRIAALEPVAPGISALTTGLVIQFNAALDTALARETGVEIIRFDAFGLLRDVTSDPARYGFSNATQACYSGYVVQDPSATVCADPSGYVFWDNLHPATEFHALLGERLSAAVTDVPEPASLGLLGCGLAAFASLRLRRRGPDGA